jgi:membrane fusion protein, adhesin transport system
MDKPSTKWTTTASERQDIDFARDSEAALIDAPSKGKSTFLYVCLALFATALLWATFAKLDEVTRGEGRVIPSSKRQVIQNLEGGIVKDLLVREGDQVTKGQVLLRIDSTGFSSNLGEVAAKDLSLSAAVARLTVEASDPDADVIPFPKELKDTAPEVVQAETTLFDIRRRGLLNHINVLKERLTQRKQELAELQENLKRSAAGREIANKELKLKVPLAEKGIISKVDVLRLEREIADLDGQIATTEQSIPKVESAVREAERLIEEEKITFRQNAQAELNTKLAELAVVKQSLTGAKDRVNRTEVRSPVDGIVNKLLVNTIGGVVRASEPMIEITPIEESLFVEARIKPSDIAFIGPGQSALVKITAYDFTIYGSLEGNVERISSDSTVDEQTKESYYLVTIKTREGTLRKVKDSMRIIPGMVASVDIITGKKSVLSYLLKPIIKARQEALRER